MAKKTLRFKLIYSLLLSIIIAFGPLGCATTIPLPETLEIVPPSKDVPLNIAAFSGKWVGVWSFLDSTALVVERINAKEAVILIGLGSFSKGVTGGYYYVRVPVLIGPRLEWTDPNGFKVTYEMAGTNKINATFHVTRESKYYEKYKLHSSYAVLKRVEHK